METTLSKEQAQPLVGKRIKIRTVAGRVYIGTVTFTFSGSEIALTKVITLLTDRIPKEPWRRTKVFRERYVNVNTTTVYFSYSDFSLLKVF